MPRSIETQQKLVQAIQFAMASNPDQRMGQIIFNAVGDDPFYIRDEEMIKALNDYTLQSMSSREPNQGTW